MTENDLVSLFEQRGYVCVRTPRSYHAINPSDVVDVQVKDGALSVVEIRTFGLDTQSAQEVERFLDRTLELHFPSAPFDAGKGVVLRKKPDVFGRLRKALGIDKQERGRVKQ